MLENKKTYITGAIIMGIAVAKTAADYFNTGTINPLLHAEEFFGGLGLIFVRKGIKKEADKVKVRL